MEQRAQSKHEKAEIPAVLSSILLADGEAWLADVTSTLTPGCTAAATSKTLVSLIMMPHSMKKDCYEDMEATWQREKHLCEETYQSSEDGFKLNSLRNGYLAPAVRRRKYV